MHVHKSLQWSTSPQTNTLIAAVIAALIAAVIAAIVSLKRSPTDNCIVANLLTDSCNT